MAALSHANDLAERHYTSLILRLMLDQHGRLVHGEIVDVASTRQEHFVGDNGLIHAIQDWLARHELEASTRSDDERPLP